MSDLSRSVVVHQDNEPYPMWVINMDHIVVEDITQACRDLGYFQVINHGISQCVMDNAVEAASGFFQLPSGAKEEFASEDLGQPVRYYSTSCSEDGTMYPRSFLKLYAHPLAEWTQYWPKQPPIYREHMATFAAQVRRVALQLMEAILQGLGLGKDYHLRHKLEEGLQLLAVNGYPEASSSSSSTTAIGMATHSDYAFLTVLLTSCPGLEVFDRRSDSWRAAPQQPLSGSLHVHVGDFMEVLSNGRVRALLHRAVLNHEQPRISIGSFQGFEMHDKVCCAQELVDDLNPKRYRDSSFRDFLDHIMANTNGSFLDSLRM